jgi:hypothetical protein
MIRIKDENELLNLLKVISSEAVSVSKRLNESADPTTKEYLKQYERDEDLYGSLSEQEEEDEESSPEETAEEEPAEEETAEEEPAEEAEEDFVDAGVSFDSITRAINNLRSGKSLKDSGVKKQAADYYDKLSDSERKALFVFLEALSEIISGQIQGKEAQDPSDPPVSINFTSGDSEKEDESPESPPEEVQPEPSPDDAPSAEEGEESEESEEDTTPPIRVNESQDISLLRKKVRRMMLRG